MLALAALLPLARLLPPQPRKALRAGRHHAYVRVVAPHSAAAAATAAAAGLGVCVVVVVCVCLLVRLLGGCCCCRVA